MKNEQELKAKFYKEHGRYWATALVGVSKGGCWTSNKDECTTDQVDGAINDLLSLLTGRHMMLMRPVSITHSPVSIGDDTIFLVVTLLAEPYTSVA